MPPPPNVSMEDASAKAVITTGVAALGRTPVLISVQPPPGSVRTPSDICCVVDVSGSMSNDALLQGEDGSMSAHGLSVLDVVKHALRTIIANLGVYDRMALVTYSNAATTIFELTEMDPAGQAAANAKLNELVATGMTNLWDGLQTGLTLLKDGANSGRLQHVMLFTDGMPNINPPRGILPMLKRLKDKSEGGRLPCTISTFGFGYELDSALLSQLATDGFGAYAFIPDAGFVGTVFVNAMTNLLVSMARDATLVLRPSGGATFATPGTLGGHPCIDVAEERRVNIGSIQYGQSKAVVMEMTLPEGAGLQATLEYCTRDGVKHTAEAVGETGPEEVELQSLRLKAVDCIRQAMVELKQTAMDKSEGKPLPLESASAIVSAAINAIRASSVQGTDAMQALLEDLEGQVSEALSREDWYQKWGIHYLPSLMFGHLTQQCNNFKDAGVQIYGGELFQTLRDAADDIFLSLPPPTPAPRAAPAPAAVSVSPARAAAPVSMHAFYDRCGG